MVYLGVNSNNSGTSSASSTVGQNKNGSRTPPELVDLDSDKTSERNGGKIHKYLALYNRQLRG